MSGKILGVDQSMSSAEDVHRKIQESEMWRKYNVPKDMPVTMQLSVLERESALQFKMLKALAVDMITEKNRANAF
tara:strand:+ start:562 stop:786 length:225 start_codon:yes stop_codon:yes gene_type:complete